MQSPYTNFREPLGLLLRMMRSRDRAAWFALQMAVFRLLFLPIDIAWEGLERKRMRDAEPSSLPILLIIGAPRSGTTLLYQTLARFLPVSYFNNFSALFARAPLTASLKLSHFNKQKKQKSADYHSYYGNTSGWNAPNDGFHVWNRWLGVDRYDVPQQLDREKQRDMQRFFNAWFASFQQPLLNKNNRNTACVPLLAAVLPNVFFIEVRREPVFVVQSLLQAREHIQGSKALGWGLGSTTIAPNASMSEYVAEVCAQVFHIDQMLRRGKLHVAPEHFISITYEDFCRAPEVTVRHIANACLGIDIDENRLRREVKPFQTTNQVRLPDKEFDLVQRCLREIYEHQ
jgi:hypothetical protein